MRNTPSSQPVDIERFEQITDGNKDVLKQLSEDYLKQAEEIISSIQQDIESRSMESVRRQAHKLRGSSTTCGITIVVEPLRKLEHPLVDSDFDTAEELLQEIKNGLEEVRIFLNDYLG